MGVSLSNLTETANGGSGRPGLGDIPESCVACVFTYLTPREICNLAGGLNRAFYGAASSDSVWEPKLPSTYPQLLSLLRPETPLLSKKKDIFAFLSRPVPFDEGNKLLWLDKVTGGLCMSVSAKAMSITGIEDRRYWSWIPTEESRFQVIAYLQQIWWYELQGFITFPFPQGVYSLSFRLHLGKFFKRLGRRLCNYDKIHGWDVKPVRFEFSTSDGQQVSRECCLDEPVSNDMGNYKRGCWIEYHVGDFVINSSDIMELRFSMKQIDCTHSKGGICVDSVSIKPSQLKDRKKGF